MRTNRGLLAKTLIAGLCLQLTVAPGAVAQPGRAAELSEEAVRARADALVAQMTPEEKAAQLTQYFYFIVREALLSDKLGGCTGRLMRVYIRSSTPRNGGTSSRE